MKPDEHIAALQDKEMRDLRNQMRLVLLDLEENAHLEAIGRELSVAQMTVLLDVAASESPEIQSRLLPILVGLPHEIFLYTLLHVDRQQIQVLVNESFAEPIQLHITVLIHDLERECEERDQALDVVYGKIRSLEPRSVDSRLLESILFSLIRLEQNNLRILEAASRALSLAWNTNRTDLVEKLTDIKEKTVRSNRQVVGTRRREAQKASGLYLEIENQLADVFGLPGKIESLKDDEPAIDALTKLSIWYLKDYEELGLVPQSVTEKDKEQLMEEVRNQLSAVGLSRVSDLKREHLYSRDLLTSYLLKHDIGAAVSVDPAKRP